MDQGNSACALTELFQHVIAEMKSSTPVFEDFVSKASKLQSALKTTVSCLAAFMDVFQKLADIATNAKGSTREIGAALTRLCLRHRSMENKLRMLTSGLSDAFIVPLQERIDDWKKKSTAMDKNHSKDLKKSKRDVEMVADNLSELQNKIKKGKSSDEQIELLIEQARHDVHDQRLILEEMEKNAVRGAMIEERSRLCVFVSLLKPLLDMEVSALNEGVHIQELLESLCLQTEDPFVLPASCEQLLHDLTSTNNLALLSSPDRLLRVSPYGSRRSSRRSSLYSNCSDQHVQLSPDVHAVINNMMSYSIPARQGHVYTRTMSDGQGHVYTRDMSDKQGDVYTRTMSDGQGHVYTRDMSDEQGHIYTRDMSNGQGHIYTRDISNGQGHVYTRDMSNEQGHVYTRDMSNGQGHVYTRNMSNEQGHVYTRDMSNGQGHVCTRDMSNGQGHVYKRSVSDGSSTLSSHDSGYICTDVLVLSSPTMPFPTANSDHSPYFDESAELQYNSSQQLAEDQNGSSKTDSLEL